MFKKIDKTENKKVWRLWFILLIELLGTFVMVFEIIAPSALGLDQFDWYNQIFGTYVMKAFWVAGFILILIYLLGKVSVNLNPAVTLSEVAVGNTKWSQAFWMIVVQAIGATVAAYVAYWIGGNVEVFSQANDSIATGNYTLDAVYPVFQVSDNVAKWLDLSNQKFVAAPIDDGIIGTINGTDSWTWNIDWWITSNDAEKWLFMIIPFTLETIYTFILISSVVYILKHGSKLRPFLIFLTLMIVVTLGISTNNIALNPARLMGPAVVAQVTGGAQTLQYSWIFLSGELTAVLLVFLIESKKVKKEGISKAKVKNHLVDLHKEVSLLKIKYNWVSKGNKAFEQMTLRELKEAIVNEKADSYVNMNAKHEVLEREFILYLEKNFRT